MARSNDEIDKLIAVAAANPIAAKLLELIFTTSTAVDLNRISLHDIPETQGLSGEEREALQEAVSLRFCALNAAALAHRDKPRWDRR